MFSKIPYKALKACALFIISMFVLNPFIRMIMLFFEINKGTESSFTSSWFDYNFYILLFGGIILVIYGFKTMEERNIKEILVILKSHPAILCFFIFAALMIISTAVNGFDQEFALTGHPYCSEGLLGCLSYIVYFLLTILLIGNKSSHIFITIFAISAAGNMLLSTCEYIFLDSELYFVYYGAPFFNGNHYGYYILVVAILFAMLFVTSKNNIMRAIYIIFFMLTTGVLLINNTWGCQLALLVGIIFICIVYSIAKKKFMHLTLVIFISFMATYVIGYLCSDTIRINITNNLLQSENDLNALAGDEHETSSGVARIVLYKATIEHISEKPILGFGPDGTDSRLRNETHVSGRCHSEYLHYTVCFGIPALIVYLAAIMSVFLRGLKYKEKLTDINLISLCCAFAYLVSAAVGNSMFYTVPYLFIMLGLGYYKKES